jgi:hypothetical protein
MKVIAIDFDGTANANPEKVNKLYEGKFNVIVIHTSRPEAKRKEVEEELNRLGVRYHALVMDKFKADIYIDNLNAGGLVWPEEE